MNGKLPLTKAQTELLTKAAATDSIMPYGTEWRTFRLLLALRMMQYADIETGLVSITDLGRQALETSK